jgi:hypothetical protein
VIEGLTSTVKAFSARPIKPAKTGSATPPKWRYDRRGLSLDKRPRIFLGDSLQFSAFLQNTRHATAVSWTTCAFFRRLMYG